MCDTVELIKKNFHSIFLRTRKKNMFISLFLWFSSARLPFISRIVYSSEWDKRTYMYENGNAHAFCYVIHSMYAIVIQLSKVRKTETPSRECSFRKTNRAAVICIYLIISFWPFIKKSAILKWLLSILHEDKVNDSVDLAHHC